MKIRDLKLAALASLLFIGVQGIANADPVSNYSELQTAIANGTTPIDINADINGANSNLGALGGNVVINGNSHTISGTNGASSYRGITVGAGQTLTINNATISGFGGTDAGAAINNSSNLTLNGVTISAGVGTNKNNDIYQSNSGATELTGANNIASNISGSGSITNSGDLTISGDNSNYSGTYSQVTGSTTVTGKGFGGESTISGGSLNWETNNAASGTLKVLGGNVAIGADESQQAALNIADNSIIDSSVGVTINDNSSLNILGTGDVAGQVTLNNTDTWNGTVKVSENGKLTLDNAVNNGEINATGGTIDIQRGTLSLGAHSEIQAAANVNIGSGTTLDVAEGSVTINANDTWLGTVNLSGTGSVTVNNIANNGTLDATDGTLNLAGGKLDIASGSQITADVETTISTGTNLNVTGGNVTLNSGDTWSGNVNLSGTGNLTVDNIANNGKLDATNGTLNLTNGKLDIASGSQIGADVIASIGSGTSLNVKGGNVTLNSGDTWAGTVDVSSGVLNVDGIASNGKINATGGTVNLNSDLDVAAGSTIGAGATTNINAGATLGISGGTVTLDKATNDTWTGTVELSSGTLNVNDINNGILEATNGNLNINKGTLTIGTGSSIADDVTTKISNGTTLDVTTGGTVNINGNDTWETNGTAKVSGGTLNVSGRDTNGKLNAVSGNLNLKDGNLVVGSGSSIADSVVTNIASGSNLKVSGGNVTLDGATNDVWAGNVELLSGTLNVNDISNGVLKATNGTLNINKGPLTIGTGSSIANEVVTNIGTGTTLDVTTGGTVNINGNDTWAADGTLHVDGGTVNVSDRTQNGFVNAETGNLNLNSGLLEIGSGSSIEEAVNTSIAAGSTLKLTGTGEVTLAGANDKWNGAITVADSGSLTLNNVAQNGTISTTGGTVDFQAGSLTIGTGSSIGAGTDIAMASGTNVEVSGSGILNLDADDTWSGDISMSGGTLNVDGATNNGSLSATNGTIDIKSGTLSLGAKSDGTATTIADAVAIKIGKDTILESNAGNTVNINGNDTWDAKGTLHLNGGEVNVSGRTQNGLVNAETGNLNLKGGSLEIGSGSQILAAVETTINTGANLNVSGGGTVNLGADDHWKGNIKLAQDGILNLSNADNSGTGDDNKGTLKAENGTLNLNNGSLTIGTGSSIADAVTTNISSGTTIDVTAGTVNINDNDEWAADGTVNLAGGTLNISNRDEAKGNGIITAGSGNLNLNSGHLVIAADSNINNDVKTAIVKDSHLDITGGNVELNGNDNWAGTVDLTDGTLTLTDAVNNGILNATGGTIDLDAGTLKLAKDSVIEDGATINIDENTNLSIAGGTANLNGDDDWSGNVLLSDGILNLNGIENGILKATGGELNLNDGKLTIGEGSSIADKTKLSIAESKDLDIVDGGIVAIGDDDNWAGNVLLNGGELNYGSTSQDAHNLTANTGKLNLLENSYLTVGGSSTLADEVKTLISSGATLDVNVGEGSVITLDSGDSWIGTVKVTTGTLALNDLKSNGIINAIGGTVDLQAGNLKVAAGSVISDDATTKIAADTNLAVTGGKVTLNDKTEWNGNVLLASGNLTLNDVQNNGVIKATGGKLNLDKGLLTVGEGSYINGEVAATIKEDTTLDIVDKGVVQIDRNDNWKGQVSLNGGTLNYNTDSNALLTANSGNLNLLAGSTFVFENGSQVADIVNVDIQKDAIVNIQNDGHLNLDTNDKWNGIINISDGVLTTTDFTNFTGSGGGLRQTGGQSIFKDNSHIYISDKTSFINGGEVQILNNSSLNYGAGASKFVADTLIMSDNSLLNLSNAALDKVVVNDSATINGTNHLTIDIAPRDWKADNFVFNDVKSDSTGTINISDFNFIGLAPIDRHIKLRIFDVKSVENVKFDSVDKEIFTPIGWYDLKASGGGYYTSNLVKYNPQVFRGQVATLAMYNNQLAIDDMILNHVTLQSERFLANGQNANKYAINQSSFAPYQYTKEDGGLWFKSYANFEHLSMNQGLRVGNNAYGSILGADFPMVHLKNGWEFLPTAFIAYNGSHQHFDGVGMYQNGGQAGFMGTFMKDDFVGSLMAYGGGYTNEMNVAGFTDKTGNWFAGTAAKAAYNLHATRHFTVQPTLMAAYNAFGEHGWHTDFGTMHMNTSMLNGISVAPGVNLIYARESWSLYTTIQYLYNINDNLTARAGNVNLHHIEMKHGYIQYGFGATKTWKDRLNSFFQITFRNGGRTGVGFQLGFQYLCDWYKPGKKIQGPTVLNSIKMAKDVKNSSQEVKSSNAIIKTAPKANLNQTTKTSNKAVIKAL